MNHYKQAINVSIWQAIDISASIYEQAVERIFNLFKNLRYMFIYTAFAVVQSKSSELYMDKWSSSALLDVKLCYGILKRLQA